MFIIGVPGTGKSTVCDELKRRGYLARDTDGDHYSAWRSRTTGEFVDRHYSVEDRNEGFRDEYEWITDIEKVAALADQAGDTTAYLFGSSANEDEIWNLAEQVVCLFVDDDTLRHRLTTRTNNDYGKRDIELDFCLGANPIYATEMKAHGATLIDATRPVDEVVEELLRLTETL